MADDRLALTLDRLEGHDLTLVQETLAGASTHYCESCGALVQSEGPEHAVTLFHAPRGSLSSAVRCSGPPNGFDALTLKGKLEGLASRDRGREPAPATPRFEDQVRIELTCCGRPMSLVGNLSLRGPSDVTRLGYGCAVCSRRVIVVDAWPPPGTADHAAQDAVP